MCLRRNSLQREAACGFLVENAGAVILINSQFRPHSFNCAPGEGYFLQNAEGKVVQFPRSQKRDLGHPASFCAVLSRA